MMPETSADVIPVGEDEEVVYSEDCSSFLQACLDLRLNCVFS